MINNMNEKNYICNPINIRYPYQFIEFIGDRSVNREGADPSLILWKDTYYLFVSMTSGFWYSKNLIDWTFKKLDKEVIYDYAPDVRIIDDYMYLSASRKTDGVPIYRSKDPINKPFEKFTSLFTYWDPNLFQDDDGKVYFYWGCSNQHPIWGIALDRHTLQPIGEKKALIFEHETEHGFERRGDDHRYIPKTEKEKLMAQYIGTKPFIEGAWMNKVNGKYYLQYAAPATQNNIYGDGVYVGKSPLGPFHYQNNNPFSYKPGGFIPGAGHGSTMQDMHGNWWHASTMVISVNHQFERRIGLFPAGFDDEGELFCNTSYGDWPIEILDEIDPLANPKWMLLSYDKKVKSSSSLEGHEAKYVVDENIKTHWTAASSSRDEWLEIDLGKIMDIKAIQVNFADFQIPFDLPKDVELIGDEHQKRYIDFNNENTQYVLEGSKDGINYENIVDKRHANTDLSHDFIVFDSSRAYQHIRISQIHVPYSVKPSLSGLRVFGKGDVALPRKIEHFNYDLESPLDVNISWQGDEGTLGYNVFFGYKENKLYHSYMAYHQCQVPIRALNKGQALYVRIDAFNEKGITQGKVIKVI